MDNKLITLPSSLVNSSEDDTIISFEFDFAMCHGPYLCCR
jgi:hypothetical protein